MGMFDYVNAPGLTCGKCEEPISGFQSKDRDCELDRLEFWQVDNFYTLCRKCGAWNEWEKKPPLENRPLDLDDYTHTY